jgi:hypothetical protein
VTRIYRDTVTGVTWIERGTGTPLVVIHDHGSGVNYQWQPPTMGALVYDDELFAVENETIETALLTERTRIRDAVAASTLPAPAKATVRKIIGEDST